MREIVIPEILNEIKPDKCIVGMAHGVDIWVARACHRLGIPYIAARPYAGHNVPQDWKAWYQIALDHAEKVVIVNKDFSYNVAYMHQRNEWMVDHASAVAAIWNQQPKGGTAACVRYALKQEKPIFLHNPITKWQGWMSV